MKNNRAVLRGKSLDNDCKRAKISTHEFGMKDDRKYCYGLVRAEDDCVLEKCIECGAYCLNAKPLQY
ncbi:MAG: hypothetical protein SPJ65_13100 [Roseburia sp.]|nr:hypothetical protein [Roseburia sp.]